jgi:hypothetical protein
VQAVVVIAGGQLGAEEQAEIELAAPEPHRSQCARR